MIKRLVVAFFMVGALSACASTKYVVSDVTRFHEMPGSPSGGTFAIVALNDDQKQSLAFQEYADVLNRKMTDLGLTQYTGSRGPSEADYVVTLKYDVIGSSSDVRDRGSNFSVGFGYSRFYHPWYYGGFYHPHAYERTETTQLFARRVELNMYRGGTYGTDEQSRVFEGRAISQGQSAHLEPVMPYILDAILKDFPGASGETKTVSVQVPEGMELSERSSSRPSARSSY